MSELTVEHRPTLLSRLFRLIRVPRCGHCRTAWPCNASLQFGPAFDHQTVTRMVDEMMRIRSTQPAGPFDKAEKRTNRRESW